MWLETVLLRVRLALMRGQGSRSFGHVGNTLSVEIGVSLGVLVQGWVGLRDLILTLFL